MNHATCTVCNLIFKDAWAEVLRIAKGKAIEAGCSRPWVGTQEVKAIWRSVIQKRGEFCSDTPEYYTINFSEITTELNKKIKKEEDTMGLSTIEEENNNSMEEGVIVGTEHNGRVLTAVKLRSEKNEWSAKSFVFFMDPTVELKSGDFVVVDSDGAPTVALVVAKELSAMDLARCSKWVIGRIDMTAHKQRLEQERVLKEMENKMDQKVKNIEKNTKYIMLAAQDPEMARMYNEMRKLDTTMPELPAGTKVAELELGLE